MSLLEPRKRVAEVGDLVIIYENNVKSEHGYLEKGGRYHSSLGLFLHDDMIGTEFGNKVLNTKKNKYVYMLSPSPEWWTRTLRHRTQVLYDTDISLVVQGLELRSGSVVVEAGTGSGSASTSFCRTIAPTGHLYTFEFHETRVCTAQEEFRRNGMESVVTVTHRDVVSDGFLLENVLYEADAAFLDIPSPWFAIPNLLKVMKNTGLLCTFSPCIEQVSKSVEAFTVNGFADIRTVECVSKRFDCSMREVSFPLEGSAEEKGKLLCSKVAPDMKGHTGFLTFGRLVAGQEMKG